MLGASEHHHNTCAVTSVTSRSPSVRGTQRKFAFKERWEYTRLIYSGIRASSVWSTQISSLGWRLNECHMLNTEGVRPSQCIGDCKRVNKKMAGVPENTWMFVYVCVQQCSSLCMRFVHICVCVCAYVSLCVCVGGGFVCLEVACVFKRRDNLKMITLRSNWKKKK